MNVVFPSLLMCLAAAMPQMMEAQTLPAAALLSGPGPTFVVPEDQLSKQVTLIAYGDQRFHDPSDADPRIAVPLAREALVAKIAEEHPDAVTMSGDVPYKGTNQGDYDVFYKETAAWRDEHLRVYPAMGNHELNGGVDVGLQNWWKAFPELKGRRWYSVALGKRIYLLELESNLPLTEGSDQMKWIQGQIAGLPKEVDFVVIGMHHPPVADIQTRIEVDHNPRPNEIALRDYLTKIAPTTHAKFVVAAGHIHNYERQEVGGVVYLVTGGGGAHPYEVDRTPDDLYQGKEAVNFHYVKFELERDELKATMYRLADPEGKAVTWEKRDEFEIKKRVTGNVSAPTLVYKVDAQLTDEARQAKVSGKVLVNLVIDRKGDVVRARVEKGLGMGLDEKALEAARQFRFTPATEDGRPVSVEVRIEIEFKAD